MASPPHAGEVGDVRADPAIQEEHLIVEDSEYVDYIAMSKASNLQACVCRYFKRFVYDIKLHNITGFTRAMSKVKWSTSNVSGSTIVDLFKDPAVDLLRLAVMDL
ncbi:La-related protein 6 [Hordeum vulgare]|nr:La-related protein 6 [Hordeum vulgare]